MIASLCGKIAQKDADRIVLDVHGVGYRLFVPLSTFYELPDVGNQATLKVHMVTREDAIHLYGFLTETEREAFICLTGVAGIGPKLARNILSGIRPKELGETILRGEGDRLKAIPGVGKRMAERILVELKDKVSQFDAWALAEAATDSPPEDGDKLRQDVISALLNLGYKKSEISRVLPLARDAVAAPLSVESWLKESLKFLAK
jgi:Holliday junction DNA helicase RuvA